MAHTDHLEHPAISENKLFLSSRSNLFCSQQRTKAKRSKDTFLWNRKITTTFMIQPGHKPSLLQSLFWPVRLNDQWKASASQASSLLDQFRVKPQVTNNWNKYFFISSTSALPALCWDSNPILFVPRPFITWILFIWHLLYWNFSNNYLLIIYYFTYQKQIHVCSKSHGMVT